MPAHGAARRRSIAGFVPPNRQLDGHGLRPKRGRAEIKPARVACVASTGTQQIVLIDTFAGFFRNRPSQVFSIGFVIQYLLHSGSEPVKLSRNY